MTGFFTKKSTPSFTLAQMLVTRQQLLKPRPGPTSRLAGRSPALRDNLGQDATRQSTTDEYGLQTFNQQYNCAAHKREQGSFSRATNTVTINHSCCANDRRNIHVPLFTRLLLSPDFCPFKDFATDKPPTDLRLNLLPIYIYLPTWLLVLGQSRGISSRHFSGYSL